MASAAPNQEENSEDMGFLLSKPIPAEQREQATLDWMKNFRKMTGHTAVPAASAAQVDEWLKNGRDPLMVDCRPENERAVSVMPGRVVPQSEFEANEDHLVREEMKKGGGALVVAYCTIGARSCMFTKKLLGRHPELQGHAFNMEGSMVAYAHAGHELVDPSTGSPTRRIHTYNAVYDRYRPDGFEGVF